MRFSYKFVLLLSVLILLSSLLQFSVFDTLFLSKTDSFLLDTNTQAAINVSQQLKEKFKKLEMSLKIMAADPTIIEDQAMLVKFKAIIPEVDVIIVLNKQGDIARMAGNLYTPPVANLADRPYIQRALQGESYSSDVYTTVNGFQVVALAVPVWRNGSVDGVVVGVVKLHGNSLAAMFDNQIFGRDGYISIIDRQGDIIYHPTKSRIGQQAAVAARIEKPTGALIAKDLAGHEQFVGYSKVEGLGWTVTVNTPTLDILRSRNALVYELISISLVGMIVMILVGTYTVRRYTEPLERIMQAFRSLTDGSYRKLPSGQYDKEFQAVVGAYNQTIERLETLHQQLADAAVVDSLTGAFNRRAFEEAIAALQQEAAVQETLTAGLCLVDLDFFKQLNDTAGHLAGDTALQTLTQLMQQVAGKEAVFRFGGDEFAILRRQITQAELAALAEELRQTAETSLQGCTLSIGMAMLPADGKTIAEVMAAADQALYKSKEQKNCVTVYQQIAPEE